MLKKVRTTVKVGVEVKKAKINDKIGFLRFLSHLRSARLMIYWGQVELVYQCHKYL